MTKVQSNDYFSWGTMFVGAALFVYGMIYKFDLLTISGGSLMGFGLVAKVTKLAIAIFEYKKEKSEAEFREKIEAFQNDSLKAQKSILVRIESPTPQVEPTSHEADEPSDEPRTVKPDVSQNVQQPIGILITHSKKRERVTFIMEDKGLPPVTRMSTYVVDHDKSFRSKNQKKRTKRVITDIEQFVSQDIRRFRLIDKPTPKH